MTFRPCLFLFFFLIVSCSQDPIDQYKSLARDVLKLDDASSVNDKKAKQEKLDILNDYVGSLVGSELSLKCKVSDVIGYGYDTTSVGDIFSGIFKSLNDASADAMWNSNLSEEERKENEKYWKIECNQTGKIGINITLIMHVNFINDYELNILENLSEGDSLSFTGIVSNSLRFFTTDLNLTFRNKLWIDAGVKDTKKIFIH